MSTILSFKSIENKHNRCKDYTKRFCDSSREQAIEIILKRKKWSHYQTNSRNHIKISCICKDKFEDKYAKDKKFRKARDHCHDTGKYRGAAPGLCNYHKRVSRKTIYMFRRKYWKILKNT